MLSGKDAHAEAWRRWTISHKDGGYEGVVAYLEDVIAALRTAVFLTGCKRPSELVRAPKVIGSTLRAWLDQVG